MTNDDTTKNNSTAGGSNSSNTGSGSGAGDRKVFDLHERESRSSSTTQTGSPEGMQGVAEDLVSEVGQQLSRFLEDAEGSIDEFFRGVRKSADQVLDIAEDRRLQSFVAVLLAGAAVGAFAAGALSRTRSASRVA